MKTDINKLIEILKKYTSKESIAQGAFNDITFREHHAKLLNKGLIERISPYYLNGYRVQEIKYKITNKGTKWLKNIDDLISKGGNTRFKRLGLRIKEHPIVTILLIILIPIITLCINYYFQSRNLSINEEREKRESIKENIEKNLSDYNYNILFDRSESMLDIFDGKEKWVTIRKEINKRLKSGSFEANACYQLSFFGGLRPDSFRVAIPWIKYGKDTVLRKLAELGSFHFKGKNNLMKAITDAFGTFCDERVKDEAPVKRIILFFGGADNCTPDINEVLRLKSKLNAAKIYPEFYCLGYGIPDSVQGVIAQGVVKIKNSFGMEDIGWNIFFCDSLHHIANALDIFLLGKGAKGNYLRIIVNEVEITPKIDFEAFEADTLRSDRREYLTFVDSTLEFMHTVDVTRMQLYYDSAKKFLDRMRRISKPIEIGRLKPEIEDYSDTVLLIHNLFYSLDKKMITAMTEYKNNNVDTFVELRTEADTIRKRIRQISLRLRDRRWQYNVNDYTDSLCIHLGNIIDSGSIGRKYLRRHLKYYQFYLTALEECYYRYEYESKRDYKDYASSRVLSSFINEADSCLRLVNKVKLNIPSTKDHLIRLQNKRADLEKQWRVRN